MRQKINQNNTAQTEKVAALKGNEDDALKKLYTENYDKVERYILNNNGTEEQAKDIYQEAFIAMWRNIQMDKFHAENEHSLSGYLLRIAKNKWIDHLRSDYYKKTARLSDATVESQKVDLPDFEVNYINAVKEKFTLLGVNCKEVLTRFYYRKESMKTIADQFEWTEATARNNKYRCLQKLRELIKR